MLIDPTISAIILGAIQGLTEFLSVSSTGHVFLFETWMGMVPDETLALRLHLGSLFAVLIYFRDDLARLLVGLFDMVQQKKLNPDGVYACKLLLATALTFSTALLTRMWFPYGELSLMMVGVTLLITASLILVAEKPPRRSDLISTIILFNKTTRGSGKATGVARFVTARAG
jgi:undecaprenyl-diphosphatase